MVREEETKLRNLLRSKNINLLSSCGYNPINGETGRQITVPRHEIYNPQLTKKEVN